ncbi:hypothetical protein CGJ21_04805 [Vibrio parahaemolyticus]|uniref:SGNH/GDSL hydrolase family protein n=2 Tax=Vibrio parahaemolyticus TaxID=670 RepID=UPI0011235AD0|nr:SGNH/GDSL hydrolase family protein [Vibrio parahaemolyticus]TOF41925.1 hypothetical protein CGJ23_01150 [Vibrio parahaemolyticus]TOF50428.1 hypothetical protein CGJ21_04805 [Vibrio parahaemolyticus]HCG5236627.1 SGNH/GDSL hydrolase family protein [Vibrio parahaemolyticus]
MKILFYGASVVQQGTTIDGDLVGFVDNLRVLLKQHELTKNILAHKRGYGSNHIDDAGLIQLEEIWAEDPDLVFLEWHSTYKSEFDERKYRFIIDEITKRNIKVINLILPKKSQVGKPEQKKILQTRGYQEKFDIPMINLYRQVEDGTIDLNSCLRDDVHTNPTGGAKYAKVIFDFVLSIVNGEGISEDKGDFILPYEGNRDLVVSKFDLSAEINEESSLIIRTRPTERYDIFAKVECGPFSPVLITKRCSEEKIVNIMDSSCYYPRKVFKNICHSVDEVHDYLEIKVDGNKKSETVLKKPPTVSSSPCRVPILGSIYAVGAEIVSVSVVNSSELGCEIN